MRDKVNLKQLIPSEYCLKCFGCCRFSHNPTIWASPGLRLLKDGQGYRCEKLSPGDNSCRIYEERPLDCQLYPFLLVKRTGRDACPTLGLGLHKSCLYIEENRPNVKGYVDYLKKALNRAPAVSRIRENPGICADYRENVEIIADLGGVYKKIRNAKALPKLNRLTLKDKPTVDKYIKRIETNLSAYHFAPLFIWKDLFKIYWALIEDNLCLFYQDKIGIFMPLAPIGNDNDRVIKKCFEIMNYYNPNTEVSRIENISEEIPGRTKLKDTEYLCSPKELAELKGDRYKHKRSSCNHFVRNYPYQVMPYSQSMLKDCLGLYQLWRNQREESNKDVIYRQMLEDSGVSFNTALRYANKIGLSGYVVKAAGKVKACSLGYPLNKETFCILFEVCDLRLKGIARFIFREFCRRLSGYKYINIMGGSDLENLKAVKMSYRPVERLEIYNVYQ